ncbi:MAG: hypothetical protein H0W73_13430 [Bacteroidetes bacterium]|nr:hypothetical protein [Bacteroidota bacterium]
MLDFLLKYYFRVEKETPVFLGTKTQKGSIFVVIRNNEIWRKESFRKKLKCLASSKWTPNEVMLQDCAKKIFMKNIFGTKSDYADKLFELMSWHNSRDWNFEEMSDLDIVKSSGLYSTTVLTRLRYRSTSKNLNLNLLDYAPLMCKLSNPMVVKIPIISFQYFLDIHSAFTFNSIRKSKHENAEDLISYLYDVLFLQQKIAVSLHEYLRLIHYVEAQKDMALFTTAEINAITAADLVFSYLKASIEKSIVILGLTHGIRNIDSKKTHQAKLNALMALPKEIIDNYYCQFVMEFIKSENLDELNIYRSGLLHKKGISDLQPHSYVGKQSENVPLKKIFQILHEQHSKNTIALIGVLAILTDELVRLDPPNMSFSEIPK